MAVLSLEESKLLSQRLAKVFSSGCRFVGAFVDEKEDMTTPCVLGWGSGGSLWVGSLVGQELKHFNIQKEEIWDDPPGVMGVEVVWRC